MKRGRGQPTKMTEETLGLLRNAFLIGCTDVEACLYANISIDTLYLYQTKHPEYIKQKEAWKDNPLLKARTTIFKALETDKNVAMWYASRKGKGEFVERKELTGKDGEALIKKELTAEELLNTLNSVEAIIDKTHESD